MVAPYVPTAEWTPGRQAAALGMTEDGAFGRKTNETLQARRNARQASRKVNLDARAARMAALANTTPKDLDASDYYDSVNDTNEFYLRRGDEWVRKGTTLEDFAGEGQY